MQNPTANSLEAEKKEFGRELLSQTSSYTSPNALLSMFFDISLPDYLDYLDSTGLYIKKSYLKETLEFLDYQAKKFPSLKQDPLTVGTLIFLARLMHNANNNHEADIADKIVVKLLLQPINVLTERRHQYE